MALSLIGSNVIDFDSRTEIQYPPVSLEEGKGYLFFARANPLTTTTLRGYVNLIALLDTSYGQVEFPLEAKFFPKGNLMAFSVAVPKAKWDKDIGCTILALPREFYKGSSQVRQFNLEMLWEDEEDYKVDAISW